MKNWCFTTILCSSFLCGLFQTRLFGAQQEWEQYKKRIFAKQAAYEGWCSKEKAEYLMELVRKIHPSISVEIGVFAGSSLLPLAAAIKWHKTGKIYGIDPWAAKFSVEGYSPDDTNRTWWSSIAYENLYESVLHWINVEKLQRFCSIMRKPAHEAANEFADGSIDFLHVDGNHAELMVLRDVQDFSPKIKPGGYILVNDAHWSSAEQALNYLLNSEEYEMCWRLSTDTYILFHKLGEK